MGLAEEAILSSNFYAVSNRISSLLEDFNFYYAKLYHFYLCISEEIQNTKIRESVSYALYVLESDFIPIRKFKGPVFLSKFDLWIDWRTDWEMNEKMIWLMYSLEGEMTAFQIAEKLNIDFEKVVAILSRFYEKGLIEKRQIEIGFDR